MTAATNQDDHCEDVMSHRTAFPKPICIALVGWLLAGQSIEVWADEPTLQFLDAGQPVQTLTRKDLAEKIPATPLTVENPTTSQAVTYQGAALSALLSQVYGDRWRSAGLVKFETRDGYQPVVPVAVINQHAGLMAYADAGQDRLQVIGDGHGGTVDPGPYYLVWENIKDSGAKKDPWLQWPWQLAKVELTSMEREYPQTAPPLGASEAVMRGFNGFLSRCAKCHQINGEGGAIGPELNYPVNVTEYWQNDWLPKFIAHPQAIRHNSKMVGYKSSSPDPSAEIDDIVAYLRAMKDRKLAPKK
jgi:cytochrome c2